MNLSMVLMILDLIISSSLPKPPDSQAPRTQHRTQQDTDDMELIRPVSPDTGIDMDYMHFLALEENDYMDDVDEVIHPVPAPILSAEEPKRQSSTKKDKSLPQTRPENLRRSTREKKPPSKFGDYAR